ncbi:hypothetical protein [Caballeronia sp. AZ1_KS37]|uniref:hypothetical protein n=1 Tax=Caballeronia sp. AZ1_KS37 TaxID=2921756 RepID=UPI002028C852|nr:hypothetical protein [Caballeronia sp. AZ1_KS37]
MTLKTLIRPSMKRHAVALVALSGWLGVAVTAPLSLSPEARATKFVVAVATSDLRSARAGGRHAFSYAPDETEATLSSAISQWLTQGDRRGLRLALADQETIFAFHWAATQMPARSLCFIDIDSDECQQELGYWLARVRNGDSRFIAAYRRAQMRLGLPPIITQKGQAM